MTGLVLVALGVPAAAQQKWQDGEPLARADTRAVGVKESLELFAAQPRVLSFGATVSGPAVVVATAATEYRFDDGAPNRNTRFSDAYDQEYAQRFRLARAGTVTSATACFSRPEEDDDPDVSFVLTFYRDAGGSPGSRLVSYGVSASGLARGQVSCVAVDRGAITRQRLGGGDTWLAVRWPNSSGKFFSEDHDGPGGTRNFWRYRSSSE